MEITNDFKNEILSNSKIIENIEVLYKKKEKFSGKLKFVNDDAFEIKIYGEKKMDLKQSILFISEER
ncbi:hypothetical protein [Chryseobacterium indoltheticum]|uniref:hypothetical protein n=1 Tax=Chryseobacterium indoltheticum TaxID=254 RepID=UPI003F49A19E